MRCIEGQLTAAAIPAGRITMLFAHGSGSSRHSPRRQRGADFLHPVGLATLLFDLLTPAEALAARWFQAHCTRRLLLVP